MTVNTSSRWSPTDYATNAAFVPALGSAALDLLAPQPGELILDLGCGDGTLTQKIHAAGAAVIGLDASPEMVEAARAKGVDAFVADAQALDLEGQAMRFGQFDAAFSNAALHWMLDPDAVAEGVFSMLKPGGRFVGEMGGQGNIAALRTGIREELNARGYPVPAADPQWYPSVEEFVRLYACAGFNEIQAHLIARPTPLPTGVAGWVKTFRRGWLDVAEVPETERDAVAQAIQARLQPSLQQADGSWIADYVRLRFSMRKPD
ncbi:class I SAM-dependent methyltransferase [Allosphingosinicella deserti]|uniref:SAM-dependent methyltransferase n=1 Tax=Allosphingosinicella deserti TaxID=2116704 RepID=A0A2P7QJ62_9SPHN|nr:class I SAM-dependent methyltransferase [Sphingomonas deserti]PSJ37999.1 SAM-dependent methyltransferase [Sphingomonas deserti]